jgi:protocatechuate 3,4-dioxygenase beta subunit
VRRYDLWVNLFQRLAEVVLFFHPAIWLLSRRISVLREYCCDELSCQSQAEPVGESRVRYAMALLRVVELANPGIAARENLAAMAASGRSPSEIRRRVARLFGEPLREPLHLTRGGMAMLLVLGALLIFGPTAWNTRAAAPVDQAADQTADQADGEPAADAESKPSTSEFHLTVVGPQGTPLADARVEIRTNPSPTADQITRGKFVKKARYGATAATDDDGRVSVMLPADPARFALNITKLGYGPYWAEWTSDAHPQTRPREFTAQLDAGWSVGGVVVDETGEPIEGVSVHPSIKFKKRPGDTDDLHVGTNISSASDGSWRYDHVPDASAEVHISLDHPDYAPLRQSVPRDGFAIRLDEKPTRRIELKRGLTVSGTVTDETGEPIAGALVRTKFLNDIREAKTNDQGEYNLGGCEPRMARIVVSAAGRATDMKELRIDPDMEPVDFSMQPGGRIRVRVVDEEGKGIPKSRIFFQRWRGRIEYFEFNHVNQYTNDEGIWEWNEAPLDAFEADICRADGMQLPRQQLVAGKDYVFQPPPALIVSGRVVDAETKQPIKKFRAVPGLRNPDPRIRMNWVPREAYEASDGTYRLHFRHAYLAHLVRVEAAGYEVAISRDIKSNEGSVEVNFELRRAGDIAATIVTAEGAPAGRAKIALGVAGEQINIRNGDIDDGGTYATRLSAGDDGRFSIPSRDEPFQLVITHAAGFAHLKSSEDPIPDRIVLNPWARIEGSFRIGPQPAPNIGLWIAGPEIHSYGDGVPSIFTSHKATTGRDGRFVFERVVPGDGLIGRDITWMVNDGATEVTSSVQTFVKFPAGQTTRVNLGGDGHTVVGALVPPADPMRQIYWNFARVEVTTALQQPQAPEPPAEVANDPVRRQAWWQKWSNSEGGQAWRTAYEAYEQMRRQQPRITCSVARDGSFRIDDVPPGDYVLRVDRDREHVPGVIRDYPFTVPATQDGKPGEPVDLGTLQLDKP